MSLLLSGVELAPSFSAFPSSIAAHSAALAFLHLRILLFLVLQLGVRLAAVGAELAVETRVSPLAVWADSAGLFGLADVVA